MNRKFFILFLITAIIFSAYKAASAQEVGQIGNSSLRISATYALDETNQNGSLTDRLETITSSDTTTNVFTANPNNVREKTSYLVDLFSTFKKVFFGIISALGIEV